MLDLLNSESTDELEYYGNCFKESLRMQPPVKVSSTICMSETVKAGKLLIRKGDPIVVNISRMQNHPSLWQEPKKFIPERFDSNSKWYNTPSGGKRNPFAFSPFLGGQRICVGKTFIEKISKLTVPTLLSNFRFSFTDEINRESAPEMPQNTMINTKAPTIMARIERR